MAAGIAAFPTIHQVVIDDSGPIRTFTFTEAAKAGQVVTFSATGVSNSVVPSDATAGEQPIGVAVYDVEAGDEGAVAMDGCIVIVANDNDTTAIDTGDHVGPINSTVEGAVTLVPLGIKTADTYYVGIMLEDLLGNGTAEMLVSVGVFLDGTD